MVNPIYYQNNIFKLYTFFALKLSKQNNIVFDICFYSKQLFSSEWINILRDQDMAIFVQRCSFAWDFSLKKKTLQTDKHPISGEYDAIIYKSLIMSFLTISLYNLKIQSECLSHPFNGNSFLFLTILIPFTIIKYFLKFELYLT